MKAMLRAKGVYKFVLEVNGTVEWGEIIVLMKFTLTWFVLLQTRPVSFFT